MMTLTRSETARFLEARDNYLILTHRRPDGDTLGSAAALCLLLRKLGKTAHVLRNLETSPRMAWLLEGLTQDAPEAGNCLVSVDVASEGMLPKAFLPYSKEIQLRIDHHGASTSFTEFELVEPEHASCAEIIFDLMEEMGIMLDAALAEAIYVGASTDTGCFRFANTTGHTLRVAAACADAGARLYQLNQELFETKTLARLKVESWMIDHLKIFADGRMALVAIPHALEKELGATEHDMDNISSIPRAIEGIKLACTLRQSPQGEMKLSARAVPGWDATRIAMKFGGGGHKGAAGAAFWMSLEDSLAEVEKAMMELYNGQLTMDN